MAREVRLGAEQLTFDRLSSIPAEAILDFVGGIGLPEERVQFWVEAGIVLVASDAVVKQ